MFNVPCIAETYKFFKTPTNASEDMIIKFAFITQVHLSDIKKSTYFFKFVLILPYDIENEKVVNDRI